MTDKPVLSKQLIRQPRPGEQYLSNEGIDALTATQLDIFRKFSGIGQRPGSKPLSDDDIKRILKSEDPHRPSPSQLQLYQMHEPWRAFLQKHPELKRMPNRADAISAGAHTPSGP